MLPPRPDQAHYRQCRALCKVWRYAGWRRTAASRPFRLRVHWRVGSGWRRSASNGAWSRPRMADPGTAFPQITCRLLPQTPDQRRWLERALEVQRILYTPLCKNARLPRQGRARRHLPVHGSDRVPEGRPDMAACRSRSNTADSGASTRRRERSSGAADFRLQGTAALEQVFDISPFKARANGCASRSAAG